MLWLMHHREEEVHIRREKICTEEDMHIRNSEKNVTFRSFTVAQSFTVNW